MQSLADSESSVRIPSPGEIVRVRQRFYLVEEVVQSRRKSDSTLLRLSCIEDDAQGQPLEVLWEREIDAEPFTGEQWDWRRESPVRPVVFQDPGEVTDEVVHLFLEHRIVQRLLGRFISQGFVYDDLSRACLAQTKDSIPRVLLTGRLALYGPSAARLHEELIVVSARWVDPQIRKVRCSSIPMPNTKRHWLCWMMR